MRPESESQLSPHPEESSRHVAARYAPEIPECQGAGSEWGGSPEPAWPFPRRDQIDINIIPCRDTNRFRGLGFGGEGQEITRPPARETDVQCIQSSPAGLPAKARFLSSSQFPSLPAPRKSRYRPRP